MPSPAIRIAGLHKSFAGREVLNGIDAAVEEGKIVAIVGASGCGKSTLLRCLNALESIDAGSIDVLGFHLAQGMADRKMLCALRSRVGMVFQEFHLFPHLNVLDNVTLAPRVVQRESPSSAADRARQILARVGLADRADAYPDQLSGGQKQRVAIARALAQNVRVLLLDEPTSALDPSLREEVREVLRGVARGIHAGSGEEARLTMLLVTHEMRLAAELADELWVMSQGRISDRGPPREVLERSGTRI